MTSNTINMHLDLLKHVKKEPLQKDLLPLIQERLKAEQADRLPMSTTYTVCLLAGLFVLTNVWFVTEKLNQHNETQDPLITSVITDNQLYR